jgi:hypothetical protein
MNYDSELEEVLGYWPKVKVFSFMFYGQPGLRDMEILELGITSCFYDDLSYELLERPVVILAKEIDEDTARAFDANRGWLIKIVFPLVEEWFSLPEFEQKWINFISDGFKELRVEHKFISSEEVESNV